MMYHQPPTRGCAQEDIGRDRRATRLGIIADADVLLQHLLKDPDVPIDWGECSGAHGAVIQVLLAANRVPSGCK